jgi:hypothetical protein
LAVGNIALVPARAARPTMWAMKISRMTLPEKSASSYP